MELRSAKKKVRSPNENRRLRTEMETEIAKLKKDVEGLEQKLQKSKAEEDTLRLRIDELLEENGKLSQELSVNRGTMEADRKIIADLENRIKQKSEAFKSELICPICNEFFVKATCINTCSHIFCEGCLDIWIENQISRSRLETCPMCRSHIFSKTRLLVMDSYIDKIIESSPEMKRSRQSLIRDRFTESVQEDSLVSPIGSPGRDINRPTRNSAFGRLRVLLSPSVTGRIDLEVPIARQTPRVISANARAVVNGSNQPTGTAAGTPLSRSEQPAANQNARNQPVAGDSQPTSANRLRGTRTAADRRTLQRQRTNIQRQPPWRY